VLVQLNPPGDCCTEYVSGCFAGYSELWCKKDVNEVISGICCEPCNTFIPSDQICDGQPCTSDKKGHANLSELGQNFSKRCKAGCPTPNARVSPSPTDL
jgi:hypothetical protein